MSLYPRICSGAAALFLAASGASAQQVDLAVFDNADGADVSGLDLFLEVSDGGSYVDFTFMNDSTGSPFISSVYFEDTTFMSTALVNGRFVTPFEAGVRFVIPGIPGSPPGSVASTPGGAWAGNDFTGRADNPRATWGIHPGESLTVRFDYQAGFSFANVLAALEDADDFRVVEHVQGLGGNGQDSVWAATTVIPAPGSAALALLGLGVAARRRRPA